GDLAVREVAREAQQHGGPLLRWKLVDTRPEAVVALGARRGRDVRQRVAGGDRAAGAGAMMIEGLAVRDREHPGPQVRVGAQAGIGAHRREEGLLEAVVGVAAADGRDEEAPDVLAVFVEEALE